MGTAETIAIDVGASAIRACRLTNDGSGGYRLRAVWIEPLAPSCIIAGQVADREQLRQALRRVVASGRLRRRNVALTASLPGSMVVTRIAVPLMTHHELAEHMDWEIGPHVPWGIQEVVYGYYVRRRVAETGQMHVDIAVARKAALDGIVDTVRSAGLRPVRFVPAVLCAASWLAVRGGRTEPRCALVEVGKDSTHVLALEEGVLRAWKLVDRGGESLTRRLAERLGCSRDAAEHDKLLLAKDPDPPHPTDPYRAGDRKQISLAEARAFSEELADLVGRDLDRLEAGPRGMGPVWVAGGAAATHGLCDALRARTRREVALWDPTASLLVDEKARESLRGCSPGALSALFGLACAPACAIELGRSRESARSTGTAPRARFRDSLANGGWAWLGIPLLLTVLTGGFAWNNAADHLAKKRAYETTCSAVDPSSCCALCGNPAVTVVRHGGTHDDSATRWQEDVPVCERHRGADHASVRQARDERSWGFEVFALPFLLPTMFAGATLSVLVSLLRK